MVEGDSEDNGESQDGVPPLTNIFRRLGDSISALGDAGGASTSFADEHAALPLDVSRKLSKQLLAESVTISRHIPAPGLETILGDDSASSSSADEVELLESGEAVLEGYQYALNSTGASSAPLSPSVVSSLISKPPAWGLHVVSAMTTGLQVAELITASSYQIASDLNRSTSTFADDTMCATAVALTHRIGSVSRTLGLQQQVEATLVNNVGRTLSVLRNAMGSISTGVGTAIDVVHGLASSTLELSMEAMKSADVGLERSFVAAGRDISEIRRHGFFEAAHAMIEMLKPLSTASPLELGRALGGMSLLQEAANVPYPPREGTFFPVDLSRPEGRRKLHELAYRFRQCLAAYTPVVLKVCGIGVQAVSSSELLLELLGVERSDIKLQMPISGIHRPAFFVVVDRSTQSICVLIRGSTAAADVLTDLCCEVHDSLLTHSGMQKSAMWIDMQARPLVRELCIQYPTFSVVVEGHSLGGGTATLLAIIWESDPLIAAKPFGKFSHRSRMHCYSFAAPCVVHLDSAAAHMENVTSVIYARDAVSRASWGSSRNLNNVLLHLVSNNSRRGRSPPSRCFSASFPPSRTISLEDSPLDSSGLAAQWRGPNGTRSSVPEDRGTNDGPLQELVIPPICNLLSGLESLAGATSSIGSCSPSGSLLESPCYHDEGMVGSTADESTSAFLGELGHRDFEEMHDERQTSANDTQTCSLYYGSDGPFLTPKSIQQTSTSGPRTPPVDRPPCPRMLHSQSEVLLKKTHALDAGGEDRGALKPLPMRQLTGSEPSSPTGLQISPRLINAPSYIAPADLLPPHPSPIRAKYLQIHLQDLSLNRLLRQLEAKNALTPAASPETRKFWDSQIRLAAEALQQLRVKEAVLCPAGTCIMLIPSHHLASVGMQVPVESTSGGCVMGRLTREGVIDLTNEVILSRAAFLDHLPNNLAAALGLEFANGLRTSSPSITRRVQPTTDIHKNHSA